MYPLEHLRNYLFWFVDAIKGSPIRRDLKDVHHIMNGTSKSSLDLYLKQRIDKILHHACTTTEFYSQYDWKSGLSTFPICNKNTVRENFEKLISTDFSKDKLIPIVTSGSTGTPFKVYHDQRKKNRNSADTLYFAGLAGFRPGHRLAYLKIWAKEKMASPFHYWQQNMMPIDVIHLNDLQIQSLIESMEKNKSSYGILGYVSALELVCRYLERKRNNKVAANVMSIITMSESLNEYVRIKMHQYFGCNVYSRYSNLENGIIAQQVPGSDHRFLINSASYYVEILKLNEDTPVSAGEAGRIVVTDLFNFALPMIRYDTGDIGTLSKSTNDSGTLFFESIEGRKLDMLYDTNGNIISSYIMYKNMWQYTDIMQYQLIQKDKKKYVLKVNAEPGFSREKQMVEEFLTYIGKDADFSVEYVDEIPLLNSGKRRKLVNEMIRNGAL
jgi:phenylacetate-CoA ligase